MTDTEAPATPPATAGRDGRRLIAATSIGAIVEWYDFYLFATLAPVFATLFFPPGNDTAALLSSLAIYAAGFLVRPLGALIFGRLGDAGGRQPAFLAATLVMGIATFAVGLLPTFETIGWWAPVLLGALRLLQGLALGGEYGGATVYVAEHAAPRRRGLLTAWMQTAATAGFLLTLVAIGACRFSGVMTADEFMAWGWRVPFLAAILLMIFSAYARLTLGESPVFRRMKAAGGVSRRPLAEALLTYPNNRTMLLALLGATAGQGVVWYVAQVYAFYFLTITLGVDDRAGYALMAAALALALPLIVCAGWLSDRLGRRPLIVAGCVLAALTCMPLFAGLARSVNPALVQYQATHAITVEARDCNVHLLVTPFTSFSECDRVRDFLTTAGLSFRRADLPAGAPDDVVTRIGTLEVHGFGDGKALAAALAATGYPARVDTAAIDWPAALAILVALLLPVALTYGPIAAFLAELFPTAVRYTSASVPYHVGNGWIGGVLPLVATAMAVATGDLYFGLWYPVGVAAATAVIGALFLRDRRNSTLD